MQAVTYWGYAKNGKNRTSVHKLIISNCAICWKTHIQKAPHMNNMGRSALLTCLEKLRRGKKFWQGC
ncbi:MAG: hypothetical protein Hyperionvirus3_141 [Hyperionvirus sp.]|uniref:Uncharacterized protein n=1 Tax=Hyperionvirus sp. TaxID=2487770 RepID=A0A3G5A6X8_9VIRU|nr:MAG: hypothetical protein Hyperionvirus3_141 [Hyperionvirus sp.]